MTWQALVLLVAGIVSLTVIVVVAMVLTAKQGARR